MKYLLLATALFMPLPATAGGWAEPIYFPVKPMLRPADLCKKPVISERTGEVLYYTNRCPGGARPERDDDRRDDRGDFERPADEPGTSPGNPDTEQPSKPGKPERPAGQNPGNDKPVGNAPFDGERGEEPSGKEKKE